MKNYTYSVSQINNYIYLLFQQDAFLNDICIQGEVSNLKYHTSGHLYFTIKDEESYINAVMFEEYAQNLQFNIKDGLKIKAFGKVSFYKKTGKCNFYVQDIVSFEKGDIKQDFEKLKQKLKDKGFFDLSNKLEIPKMPNTVAIITSTTGAAVKDIISVARRRNPNVKLIVIQSLMQGESASFDIISAIEMANRYGNIDTIIIARGGGSYEDLTCFNDEEVANAIFSSSIPIISGIGHEIDFTIADFVADYRAPTPSAAIEIAIPSTIQLSEKLIYFYEVLNNRINNILNDNFSQVKRYFDYTDLGNFHNLINTYITSVENDYNILNKDIDNLIEKNKLNVENAHTNLDSLNPLNILKRGYSIIQDEKGNILNLDKQFKKGQTVYLTFTNGTRKACILE